MKLKEKEQLIFNYIKAQLEQDGYPPTVREICQATGIKSPATAHGLIKSLVEKGYLKKNPSKNRSISLVEKPTPEESIKETTSERTEMVHLPLVGQVAAGMPILAEQHIEEMIPFPSNLANNADYVLRVKGESMINVGIMDGDMILVEKASSIKNGDIVVAMLDGFESEATVKTFYKEKEFIRLQPENDTMSPIYTKDVKILGKVKAVFRSLE